MRNEPSRLFVTQLLCSNFYLYTKSSNQQLQFSRVVNSLKTLKTTEVLFRYSSARPPKARDPRHLPSLPNG